MVLNRLFAAGVLFAPVFFFCLLVLFAKAPGGYLVPAAHYEDGRYLFGYYHANDTLSSVWQYYAGYVSLAPNIIAFLIGKLPISAQPALMALSAALVTALACSFVTLRQISLGLGGPSRTLLAFVLVLAPVSNFALSTVLMYSLWPLLFILALISFFWDPKFGLTGAFIYVVSLFAIFSHPACIVLTPVLIYRLAKAHGNERVVWLSLCGAIAAYLLFGIDHGGAPRVSTDDAVFDAFRGYSERIVFESVFGTQLRLQLIWRNLTSFVWVFAVALTLLLFLISDQRGLVFALLAIAVLLVVFGNISRGDSLASPYSHRYSIVSSWLFLIAMFLSIAPAICDKKSNLGIFGIVTAFVFWGVTTWALQAQYFILPEDVSGEGVQLAKVVALIRKDDNREFCYRLERGRWSFVLSEGQTC